VLRGVEARIVHDLRPPTPYGEVDPVRAGFSGGGNRDLSHALLGFLVRAF
jgi:hypothetical protein